MYNHENAQDFAKELKEKIQYPYVNVQVSTLGGLKNVAILLTISEQAKENWPFGIMENSQYRHFYIENDGTVENFRYQYNMKRLRKFKAKNIDKIADKINAINSSKLLEI